MRETVRKNARSKNERQVQKQKQDTVLVLQQGLASLPHDGAAEKADEGRLSLLQQTIGMRDEQKDDNVTSLESGIQRSIKEKTEG